MASARFPPPNSNDFRLPSLKDLNFPYRPLQDEQQSYSRSTTHENSTYPVQSSSLQPVPDELGHSPNQLPPKRPRVISRDIRTPHTPYPQYAPYPQQQPPHPSPTTYHQISTSSALSVPPPPPPHDQIHPNPVAYPPPPPHYQSQFLHPRIHPHHPQQPQPHPNPYPSPAPPQGPWISPQPTTPIHHQPVPPPPPPPPPSHSIPPPQHHPPQPLHQQPTHISPHAITLHPPPPPPPHVAHVPPTPQSQPQHSQQPSFSRPAVVVPTNVSTRDADLESVPSIRDSLMLEVVKHCSTLYSFARNHAQFPTPVSHAQPPPSDLTEMSRIATQVVHMLESWKRTNISDVDHTKLESTNDFDDSRPPKRPWEDMSRSGAQEGSDVNEDDVTPDNKAQTTAEQDMELIRTKRATSTAGASGAAGQPKSKYRKRSRATPPGKCHSCNIRETPEWRRGPDGARTLCNACGLHYAKLMRKKEKSGNGKSEHISLEDLRASARSGEVEKNNRPKPARAQQQSGDSISLSEGSKQPPPQQHHQGSFHVMTLAPDPVADGGHQALASNTAPLPPHPWPAPAQPPATIPHPHHVNASTARYPPEQFQHQSFMRSSQHVVIPQASPR